MRPVCSVHTTRNADGLATSVAVQSQTSLGVFLATIQQTVCQEFLGGKLAGSVEHLVRHQGTYFPVNLTTLVAEMLVAVETVPLQHTGIHLNLNVDLNLTA